MLLPNLGLLCREQVRNSGKISPRNIMKRKATTLAIMAFSALAAATGHAAYTLTGTSITENFNGLPTATIASVFSATIGTQAAISGTGFVGTKAAGTGTAATGLTADAGTSTSGGIYSYGAASNSERALGMLASGTNTMAFGFEMLNSTSAPLTALGISFTSEFWRSSTTTQNSLVAAFASGAAGSSTFLTDTTGFTAVTQLNVVGPPAVTPSNGALDGNNAVNQTAVSFTITGLNIPVGQSFYLRFTDTNDGGNDAGLAIDNLTVTAVPEPSTALLGGLGLLALLRRRRR